MAQIGGASPFAPLSSSGIHPPPGPPPGSTTALAPVASYYSAPPGVAPVVFSRYPGVAPSLQPARWQFWDDDWRDYSPADSAKLEQHFLAGAKQCDLLRYMVFIPEMLQMNSATSFRRAVRRLPLQPNQSVEWEHINENGLWITYTAEVADTIELAKTNFVQICFHDTDPWVVDVQKMVHITQRGDAWAVRRKVLAGAPSIALAPPSFVGSPVAVGGGAADVMKMEEGVGFGGACAADPVPVPAPHATMNKPARPRDRLDDLGIGEVAVDPTITQCTICLDDLTNADGQRPVIQMAECHNHAFHRECIIGCINKDSIKCPMCARVYGRPLTGNQPDGTMDVQVYPHALPGHADVGTIVITYTFPPSRQLADHPSPGMPLPGDMRRAFVPNSPQGQEVLRLLRIAWERRLLFSVGVSLTLGPLAGERIVWNGVHHKTQLQGEHGYPDPTYLARVKDELAQLGVV